MSYLLNWNEFTFELPLTGVLEKTPPVKPNKHTM